MTGEADYLLYVDGQIAGVIEAKPEGHTLTGVETQSAKYTDGLPPELPCWRKPPPFAYESTGAVTQFTNTLDPDPRSREVFTFHRPEELLRLVELDSQLRSKLRSLPELNTQRLWRVQIDAVQKLEKSLAQNRPRGLIQMATGTRKVTDDDGVEREVTDWQKVANLKREDVLTEFRNSFNPRIAVTVDMISTGTDVKPLECLLFMRNIASSNYYEQMKGRGVRVIDADTLKQVTPDAKCKTRFVIVDAVGVTESKKGDSQPLDRQPAAPLKKVLETVAKGVIDADLASTLASRLTRLDQGLDEAAKERIKEIAGGKDLPSLCRELVTALAPDAQATRLVETKQITAEQEPTEQQLDKAERELLKTALRPFLDPKLRDAIMAAKSACEQVIDEVTPDELLQAGFDAQAMEKAQSLVKNFKQFIADNKDELEAIRVFFSRPYRAGLRFKAVKELAEAIKSPPLCATADRLWLAFQAVEPHAVKGRYAKLADLIALVRHAIDPKAPLVPFGATVEERYADWLAQQQSSGITFSADQRRWLDAIKDHIAASLSIEQDDFDYAPFAQLGGLGRAYDLFGERLPAILEELNERLAA